MISENRLSYLKSLTPNSDFGESYYMGLPEDDSAKEPFRVVITHLDASIVLMALADEIVSLRRCLFFSASESLYRQLFLFYSRSTPNARSCCDERLSSVRLSYGLILEHLDAQGFFSGVEVGK